MKKLLLASSLVLTLGSNLVASQDIKEIFVQKCAICHKMTIPSDKSTMLGPPARGIMFHMNVAFNNDNKIIKNHILDFVLNPTKEKAICRSVNRFGLMPSQKGVITKDELEKVAQWMIENLSDMTKAQHKKNQNQEPKPKACKKN